MTTSVRIVSQDGRELSGTVWTPISRVVELAREVEYARPGEWRIEIRREPDETTARIRIGNRRPDTFTGEIGWGYGGSYLASQHATDSEIVQAIFGLFKAYEEHETREGFLYRGRRIFGPHMSIQALHEIADRTDARVDSRARA